MNLQPPIQTGTRTEAVTTLRLREDDEDSLFFQRRRAICGIGFSRDFRVTQSRLKPLLALRAQQVSRDVSPRNHQRKSDPGLSDQ